ncbi:small acid-soluble spore protein SspI [Paenibacillus sp. GD4]|jgi:small acid-soluble spore protein I (minor)|uniref:small acid-soluble spore protein SspI n=1 Tax=Paenibacillus TaxID=44249 RepID=UPI0025439541|nr:MULTISPECIES: small acid-soluble spore protein SspI [Paenibacillus]MDQ1911925.1 small acid-soluble spore protein SspI [Paenibacillus sp. GD4]
MNLNLRQAIVQRVQGKNDEELRGVIEDSIDAQEQVLPGLGVLFEIIWKNCGADVQNQLISTLKDHVSTAKV